MSKKEPKLPVSQTNETDYKDILNQVIDQIRAARVLIAKQVNNATQSVYWNLGKLLFEKKNRRRAWQWCCQTVSH